MNRLTIRPPTARGIRGSDAQGEGHFGASRGDRLHVGADFVADVGTPVCAPITGTVNRVGYCYGDDPSFRLIEIVSEIYVCRVLYVTPAIAAGTSVDAGDVIGTAQDLRPRYPGITPHVHCDLALRTGVLCGRNGEQPPPLVYLDPALVMEDA